MESISDMPEKWAESDIKSETEAFEQALKRIKPIDNIHTAYQRGYDAGYKAATKLVEENAELRRQLREQSSQIQNLRECIRRTQEEWYD